MGSSIGLGIERGREVILRHPRSGDHLQPIGPDEPEKPAQRAIEIDPNDVTANFWLANQLAAMGHIAESETATDRALGADQANALFTFYKAMGR